MKRTRKKKPLSVDAILTADWHLREDQPACRTDDFEEAQWSKVQQVTKLQKKHNCPVLHAGDLFHHWKPSPHLLTRTLQEIPKEFYTIYGNHDLPQHSMDLTYKSGLTTLIVAKGIHWLAGGSKKEDLGFDNAPFEIRDRKILVAHVFTYTGKPDFPGAEKEPEGHWLLDKYPDYDLILTGDNHKPFVCKDEGRLLVNPGSLTRQTAGQKEHRPRVWLYNTRKNKVKPYYLDIEKDVISRQYIEQVKERDERIEAFVERLGTEWEADLDFRENLKRFEKENDIDKPVMEICYKALEEK